MHKYLNSTTRSVAWIKRTSENEELDTKPPYQRNPVWTIRQKTALITTILYEYPIPELYMQELTDAEGRQRFIIVDGQQRIKSVLDFVNNEFELSEEGSKWDGLRFEELSAEDRKKVYEYTFIVRVLPEISEPELREIFQRINRNTQALNPQELRHATYWGPFIKLQEEIAEYPVWDRFGLFSANDRKRMLDVEYVSELSIAYLNGLQNKKQKLEDYYILYEQDFEQAENLKEVFVKTLGELDSILPIEEKLRWRKKSDFYTLFYLFSKHVEKLPLSAEKRTLAKNELIDFSNNVDKLSAGLVDKTELPAEVAKYLEGVERAASDFGSRSRRYDSLLSSMRDIFTE